MGQNRKSLHLWKIDLDRKNKAERTQFQDTLLGRLDINELRLQPPEIVLQTIAYQAVESTIQVQPNKRHQPSFRSTYKNGWSPQFVAYKVHLATLIEISARLLENGRRQSPRPGHAAILKHLTTDWTNQIIAIDPLGGLWPTLDITGIGPLHLNTFTFDELGRAIPDQIKVLKRKMHGKQRTALRVRINEAVAAREASVQQGKLARVIKSMTGTYSAFYAVDSLLLPDGTITVDPLLIHQTLTAAFTEHFKCPEHHRQSALQQTEGIDHSRFLSDKYYFLQQTAQHHIPQDIIEHVWAGVQAVPNQGPLQQDMEAIFAEPITLADFQEAVRLASTNTAPSPSGLSFNMIKSLPEDVLAVLFSAVNNLWTERTIPAQWKWRWLCLKPKTDHSTPSANDLRPLCLVDCVRKLWGKVLLRRIQRIWSAHKVIADNQHCRSHRGCSTALLEFQAANETAQETKTNLYFSSWDIKRAFDSVSKTVIKLSWMRLGLPAEIADYMVAIDDDSKTLIRTPVKTSSQKPRQTSHPPTSHSHSAQRKEVARVRFSAPQHG